MKLITEDHLICLWSVHLTIKRVDTLAYKLNFPFDFLSATKLKPPSPSSSARTPLNRLKDNITTYQCILYITLTGNLQDGESYLV